MSTKVSLFKANNGQDPCIGFKMRKKGAIELEVLGSVKIHPVVDVSRVQMYKDQVENQKKECPLLVIIEEEEYKVEKILNKRKFREKDRYLV